MSASLELLLGLGMISLALLIGIAIGRRTALTQHWCPPPISTEQLFEMQEREWVNRGTKRYDIITVHNSGSGRHSASADLRQMQQNAAGSR